MNTLVINTVLFALILTIVIAILWWLIAKLNKWVRSHEQVKIALTYTYYGTASVFAIWLLYNIGITSIKEQLLSYYDHTLKMINYSYKTPHQQRREFLETHCERVDIGYEILNDGKSTYKCPNGKEYTE